MQLTLDQAAVKLGKTARQVRYMIAKGELKAHKAGRMWVIESDDLPETPGQKSAEERKQRQLRAAVEKGLDLPAGSRRKRYSVRDLKAIQIGLPIYEQMRTALGPEHPATRALHQAMDHLSLGCHRYDYDDKAAAYRQARDAASRSICELLLAGHDAADELITSIEQDMMAALAGLLRRLDRKRLS